MSDRAAAWAEGVRRMTTGRTDPVVLQLTRGQLVLLQAMVSTWRTTVQDNSAIRDLEDALR